MIGSWVLWKIETHSQVRQSNMVKLVTSDILVQMMNAVKKEEVVQDQLPALCVTPESNVAESQQSTS